MKRTRWMMLLAALAAGCGGGETTDEDMTTDETTGGETEGETNVDVVREDAGPVVGARAVAEVAPTEGNSVSGTVVFTQQEGSLSVSVELTGFEAGSSHGFHVHETGDCSAPDGTSAGGHYNPEGHDHALPDDQPRHAGDMGNITADDTGAVMTTLSFDNISLGGENPIGGKAVIVHASPDDGGQPTGNAGARVACGVIVPGGEATAMPPSAAAPPAPAPAEEEELSP